MDTGEFVPLGEARRRLGISGPTLRRRLAAGELPVYVGLDRRLKLVKVADVEALRVPRPAPPAKEPAALGAA